MNASTIITAIKDFGGKAAFKLEKYSPEIALGVGIISFGATIYEATKAAPSLEKLTLTAENKMLKVKEASVKSEEYAETDAKKDKAAIIISTGKDLVKLYGPTVMCATISIASFLCSYRILSSRNTALIAAYATLEEGFKKYRSKIASTIGEEAERSIYYGFEEKTVTKTITDDNGKKKKVKEKKFERDLGWNVSPYAAFFDEESIYWQRDEITDEATGNVIGIVGVDNENRRIIEMVERWANDELQHRYYANPSKPGMLYLSEVYKKLGLDIDNQAARICGWGYDPDRPDLFANGVKIDIVDIDSKGGMLIDFNVDGPVAMMLPKYFIESIEDEETDE